MKLAHVSLVLAASLVCALAVARRHIALGEAAAVHREAIAASAADPLDLLELLQPGTALAPSHKAVALAGKRVRMTGFMAQMELAPKGAFYLAPRPVSCDEAGNGTADLPPASVLVIVRSARGSEVPFMAGPLEVSGTLEVGNAADDEGRVSAFRLLLDAPPQVNGGNVGNGVATRASGPT